jgi:hemoglobin
VTQTIYEWAGGSDAFSRWLNRFYDLVELEAPEIAAMFGGMVSEQHRDHVTDWWVEVMGGPAVYTEQRGGYEHMLARHHNLAISAEQRLTFVTLLSRAADDAGLPSDPEFRAAIIGYAEWGTRLAQRNSQPDAKTVAHAPVPRLGVGSRPTLRAGGRHVTLTGGTRGTAAEHR